MQALGMPRHLYMVVPPDGESFIVSSFVGQTIASPISVILNWQPPVRR